MLPGVDRRPVPTTLKVAGVCAVAGVALLAFLSATPGDFDDMFIVLVYARHLLEDGGLFWNRLDGPVEGFTSPLDLLAKVLATGVAPGDPIQAVFWCTVALYVLCAVGLIFLVLHFDRARAPRAWGIALIAGATLATNYSAAFASSFLLETPLFLLSVLAVLMLWFGRRDSLSVSRAIGLAAALAALALSRPEGVALMLVVMGMVILGENDPVARGRVLRACGLVIGLLAALLALRRVYFGAWLPNTYYAKTSSVRWHEIVDGARYLKDGVLSLRDGLPLIVALGGGAAVLLPRWRDARSRRLYAVVAVLALTCIATVVVVGGDSYPGGRFLAVPSALGILLLAAAGLGLHGWPRAIPIAMLVVVLVLQGLGVGVRAGVIREQLRRGPLSVTDFACEAVAFEHLAGAVGRGPVAQSDAQRLKYFQDDVHVIDLHGLNNREIARRERTRPVLWGRYHLSTAVEVDAPVWIWGLRWLAVDPMSQVPMERLVSDRRLVEAYTGYRQPPSPEVARRMVERYVPASIPACGGHFLNVLVHRDRGREFQNSGVLVGGQLGR